MQARNIVPGIPNTGKAKVDNFASTRMQNAFDGVASPAGVSANWQVGTAVAIGDAVAAPAGVAANWQVGTAVATGTAVAAPAGVSAAWQVGTAAATGRAIDTSISLGCAFIHNSFVADRAHSF